MTTDDQNEQFIHVNEHDVIIGAISRSKAHKNRTLIHRSVGILICNCKGEVYLHRRSSTKDTDPGKWSISASGHVTDGQSYEEAAKRELFEELGVKTTLTFLEKNMIATAYETEIAALYRGQFEGPFLLNIHEVAEGRFFAPPIIERMLREGQVELTTMSLVNLKRTLKILPERVDLNVYVVKTFPVSSPAL